MKLDVTTKRGYDLAAALRGPDKDNGYNSPFKSLVTAPLRGLLGIKRAKVGKYCCTPEFARCDDGHLAAQAAQFAHSPEGQHVREHAQKAYSHLKSKAAKEHFEWLKTNGIL